MNVTQHEHSPSVFFYPIGLSDSNKTLDKGWEANTYAGFLRRFNEENVSLSVSVFIFSCIILIQG